MRRIQSIRVKLLLSFSLLIIIGLGTIYFFTSKIAANQVIGDNVLSTTRELRQIDTAFDLFFEQIEQNCKMLSRHTLVRSADSSINRYLDSVTEDECRLKASRAGGIEQKIYEFFVWYASTHPKAAYVYMATDEGGYIQWPEGSVMKHYDPRERPFYTTAVGNEGKVVQTEPYYFPADDEVIISTVTTIRGDDGRAIGVQGVDVSLAGLTDMVKELEIGKNGFVLLTTADGTILTHPADSSYNFKSLYDIKSAELNEMFEGRLNTRRLAIADTEMLAVQFISPDRGWRFIAMVPWAEIHHQVRKINRFILFGTGAIAFVFIFMAMVMGNSITKSILKVSSVSANLAKGDADLTNQIPVTSNDETGVLAKNVNSFIGSLREIVEHIKQSSEQSKKIEQDLHTTVEETSSAVEQINGNTDSAKQMVQQIEQQVNEDWESISRINGGINSFESIVESQSAAVAETSSAITEMVSAIQNLNTVIQQREEKSHELVRISSEGRDKMSDTSKLIHKVQQSADTMKQALGSIDEMAEQTNILSINAAIEAANAGISGKGFVVVAEEVRKLAKTSAENSRQIENELDQVLSLIRNVSEVGEETRSYFDSIYEVVREFSYSMREAGNSIREINNGNKEILESVSLMQELTSNVRDTSAKIRMETEKMEEGVQETQNHTGQIVGAFTEMQNGAGHIVGEMHRLRELVTSLKERMDDIHEDIANFRT